MTVYLIQNYDINSYIIEYPKWIVSGIHEFNGIYRGCMEFNGIYAVVMTHIAIENGPVEIVNVFPLKAWWIFP